MFLFGLLASPILEITSPTSTIYFSLPYILLHLQLLLRASSLYLLLYSLTLGAYRCFLRSDISLPAPLVSFSICFRRVVSSITSNMSHRYSLTRNPTPPALLLFLLLPFLFFPFRLSSPTLQIPPPPPLSPTTLGFPLCLGRAHLLVRQFLSFRSLPWRTHIRSMILF